MALLLCLETSTDVCSVALCDNDSVVTKASLHEPQAHSARLAPLIDQVMKEARADRSDLQAVAVSTGPGSYTGLRIGTSTAKGLCYALGIPLIGVGTLDLLAFQGSAQNPSSALLCPMIDARRMEVYAQVTDAALQIVVPPAAFVIDAKSFAELLSEHRMLFFGNGADKCREVIDHPRAAFLPGMVPLASAMGPLAFRKYAAGQFEDLVHFTPFYLKEFVAKRPGGAL